MSYSLFIHFKNRSTLIQAIVYSIAVNWFAKIIDRYLWYMASGFSPPHSSQQWCAQKRTHLQPFCSKFDIVWAGRGVFSYQSQYKSPKTFGFINARKQTSRDYQNLSAATVCSINYWFLVWKITDDNRIRWFQSSKILITIDYTAKSLMFVWLFAL